VPSGDYERSLIFIGATIGNGTNYTATIISCCTVCCSSVLAEVQIE